MMPGARGATPRAIAASALRGGSAASQRVARQPFTS